MSHDPAPSQRLLELIAASREGQLSVNEASELDEQLRDSAAARQVYLKFGLLQSFLEMELSGEPHEVAEPVEVASREAGYWKYALREFAYNPIVLSSLVAGLTITIIVLSLALITPGPLNPSDRVVSDPILFRDYVAHIARVEDCTWVADARRDEPLAAGEDLYAGERVELKTGRAEIAFDDGARVWIEGPAILHMDQADACLVERGRLIAEVPRRAAGFTVHTAAAEIIDIGTRFLVCVEPTGRCELHVLQGKVVAQQSRDDKSREFKFELIEGQSMVFGVNSLPSRMSEPDLAAYEGLGLVGRPPQEDRWNAALEYLLDDPDLVAAWLCRAEDAAAGRLNNHAATDVKNLHCSDSIAARWQTGRWATKPTLDFRGEGTPDRVEIANSTGEPFQLTEAFTLSAWIRVDEFSIGWQAIVTKGDDSWRLHRFHNTDQIAFGITGWDRDDLASEGSVNDGQWHHVVCVFETMDDVAHKRIYIDGVLDASGEQPAAELPHSDAPVWIGNNFTRNARTFDGQIDEVLIYHRAFDAEEVAALHAAGVP